MRYLPISSKLSVEVCTDNANQRRKLPGESLKNLLKSLLSFLPEDTTPRVIVVKPDIPQPTPIRPNGTKTTARKSSYDPSMLLILEFATSLALRDSVATKQLGKDVSDALQTCLRESGNLHPEMISRVGYCLLELLRATNVR